LQFEECNEALCCVMKQLDMNKVNELIDETPLISDVQRMFYKHILKARYDRILKESFDRLTIRG
jgi:hypothetical protein